MSQAKAGNFVYKDSVLQYILMSEGRIVVDEQGDFSYEYHLKDHLGNVRVVFVADEVGAVPVVVQENGYYPFGMTFSGVGYGQDNKNKYLYNGKELQTDLDLGWLDYGARMYDPAIARWHSVDNALELYYAWSPYNYGLNSPIVMIDPSGDTVRYASPQAEAAFKAYEAELARRETKYLSKEKNHLSKAKTAKSERGKQRHERKAKKAKQEANEYTNTINELDAAHKSRMTFRITVGQTPSGGAGQINYNTNTGEIDIIVLGGDIGGVSTMGKIAHEFKHVAQFLRGDLDFYKTGMGGPGVLYDIHDEEEAFQWQNHFGQTGTPWTIEDYAGLRVRYANDIKEGDSTKRSFHQTFPTTLSQEAYLRRKNVLNFKNIP